MSSPSSSSGPKRSSILQGVYEENVRTRRGEPAPRRPEEDQEVRERRTRTDAPQAAAREKARSNAPPRSRPWHGAVAWALVAVLVLGSAGVYATGYAPGAWQRLLPPAQASSRVAGGAAPVADSAQGRSAPFAPAEGSARLPRALTLAEEGERSVAGLFGLEVQTVVIDPGHGGKKDGAIGPAGTKEKHVALDVARRLERRLEARPGDYRVLLTRRGDRHLSLRERVRYANTRQADLFVSVHVNALPDSSVRSVETYYYGKQTSEAVRRLARRENQNSGYSVAAFNRLLEQTGQRLRREESKRLAGSIQSSLFRNIHDHAPEVRDWGVRTAPFVVLLGVEAPSVLAEIGVLSNPTEEQKLRRPAYRARLAAYLEEGVARYLGTAGGDAPSGDAPSGDAPSGDAPSGDAPSGDAPSGDAPSGDAPSGDAPSGDAPSGDAPSGDAPSGDAPSGDAPTAATTTPTDTAFAPVPPVFR